MRPPLVIQANSVISKAMRTAFRTVQISGFLLDAGIIKTRACRLLLIHKEVTAESG